MSRRLVRLVPLALVAFGAGCEPRSEPVVPTPPTPTASVGPTTPPAPADPLGDKPGLGAPKAFTPPAPVEFTTAGRARVWLVQKGALPMVSVTLIVPAGSIDDPRAKPGLASITADMLDEGAGTRSAVELSTALNDLGATLGIGVGPEGTRLSLTVLKKNFAPAFAILADVVARPRFEAKEWKRVSELWLNGLKKRADDPAAVARVVMLAAGYGPDSAYAHPSEGTVRGSKDVTLDDVKKFYASFYRPENLRFAVAGDLSQAEFAKALDEAFGSWKPGPPPPRIEKPTELDPRAVRASVAMRPRLVVVDRAEAPQAVIGVVREGVAAGDAKLPLLELVNTALGGSFTSRLNQNLREDHHYTYGARSWFSETKAPGLFQARAAVHTDKTGPALKEMLGELDKMAASGLAPEELGKVLAQDRGELVQTYETVGGTADRLGTLAILGLPAAHDVETSRARQAATLPRLAELAKAHVDPKGATVVVVGPKDAVLAQLAPLGLGEPEFWDAEGVPLGKPGGAPKAAATPKGATPPKGAPSPKGEAGPKTAGKPTEGPPKGKVPKLKKGPTKKP